MNEDLLVTKPVRNGRAGLEASAELSARNVKGLNSFRNLVDRLVLVCRRQISHLLERHHLDLEFISVLGDKVLRIVGAVEVLSFGVLSGASVVTADDKVGCTEVFTDNGVPYGFARACHAHRLNEMYLSVRVIELKNMHEPREAKQDAPFHWDTWP